MIRGEGPEEARAEIIEIADRPLPPAATDRRATGQADGRPRTRPILSRRWGAICVAAIAAGLLLTAVVGKVLSGPSPSVAPGLAAIFPATAGGLTVISVTAANLTDSAGSGDATELAVGGWYSELRTQGPCYPANPPGSPCPPGRTGSFGSTPAPRFGADGTALPGDPDLSTLVPVFVDPVDPPDLEASPRVGTVSLVAPSALVLIGHFHDDRGTDCSTGTAQSVVCDPAFVVDAVSDLRGVVRTAGGVAPPGIRLSRAGVVSSIRGQVQPGGYVLEFGPVDWLADPTTFSAAESSPDVPLFAGPTVWLIRGYLNGLASWMAMDDVTGQVWGPLAVPLAVTPLGAEFPTTIDGLPVQSVSAAVPTGPSSSGLVAVGGYLSNDGSPEGCPPAPTTGRPHTCGGTQLVLIDDPGSLLQPNDATFLYEIVVPPSLQSIRPVVLAGTTVPDPWAGLSSLESRLASRPVVLVGQFGDRRSPQCAARPGGGNPGCDRSFVVDQIAWIDGVPQGPSEFNDPALRPVHTRADVAAAVAGWFLPGATPAIVSLTSTLPADAFQLTGVTLEPRPAVLFWVVHVVSSLPTGPTTTFLVFDDRTLNLVEVTAGG